MKEEWKVFIKGVPSRGDEVIKILEDLGATNSNEYKCCYADYLYYIGHDGNIRCEYEEREEAKIIMDNYHEIKLYEQWNDGDILIRKDNNNLFCVYQKPVCNGKGFLCYVYVSKDTLFTEVTVSTEATDNYRKATDAEKSMFYSLINNHHMRWDAEKKQLTKYRYKPGIGEIYWVVSANSNIVPYKWDNDSIDNNYFDFGNCFKTKEEAEAMAEKIKKLLKGEQL